MRKFKMLFAVIAAFFAFGAAAQAGVTVTPNTPTYTGANGNGFWTGTYTVHDTLGLTYQYRTKSVLYVSGMGYVSYSGAPANDAGSFTNYSSDHVVTNVYLMLNGWYNGVNYNCAYPGFHWFGTAVYGSARELTSLGWTAWHNTYSGRDQDDWYAVSSGSYGQACV